MAETTTLESLRRSPLAGLRDQMTAAEVVGERAVRVREVPFQTMVSLRVDPDGEAARALEQVLGTALPRTVGEVGTDGQHAVLWLGPDEWLVVSPVASELLVPALLGGVGEQRASVVDVSANRTVVEMRGPGARVALEKGCPLDLHPRALPAGRALTTTLARVPVLLWKLADDRFWLLPRASFADYVARWVLDAVVELGPPDEPQPREAS